MNASTRRYLAANPATSRGGKRANGFAMIEVLVAMVISIVGILGLIGLQARAYQAEVESYQRSAALVILEDIAARLRVNSRDAAAFVASGIGVGKAADCELVADTIARDLCEIGNNLRGTAESADGTTAGTAGGITQGRACITNTANHTYLIAVAWAGLVPTGPSVNACGRGEYADEDLRRTVTTIVVIPDLGA